MSAYSLVHINVFRVKDEFAVSHPNAQYFFSQVGGIFSAADENPDMLWHNHAMRTVDGTFLDMEQTLVAAQSGIKRPDVITMAAWTSFEALHQFTYRQICHRDSMKRLRDWADRSIGAQLAMWWHPKGQRVSIEDGWEKITQLRAEGPSSEVFTLQTRFERPDAGPIAQRA